MSPAAVSSPLDQRTAAATVVRDACTGSEDASSTVVTKALPRGVGGVTSFFTDFLGRRDLSVGFALVSVLASIAFILGGGAKFDQLVGGIAQIPIPILLAIEITVLWAPILYHTIYGFAVMLGYAFADAFRQLHHLVNRLFPVQAHDVVVKQRAFCFRSLAG